MQLQSTEDGDRGPETTEDQVEEDGGGGGSFERERTTTLAKSGVPRGCDRRIFAATRLHALLERRLETIHLILLPPHRPRAVTHTAMAPPTKASGSKAKSSGGKKEKVFHPQSRKAGQLVRTQLRKSKLVDLARERHKKQGTQGTPIIHLLFLCLPANIDISSRAVSIYGFFFHALPPEGGELSLDELHYVVRDVWLTRHNHEIEAERAARRKGRPKSAKEQKLEELQLREKELYRTGMGEHIVILVLNALILTAGTQR